MTANRAIEHHQQARKFTLREQDDEAVLQYRLSPGAVDFTQTYVPPHLRGKGLAELLVRHGIKWAREQGYEIHASCWYVARFLR